MGGRTCAGTECTAAAFPVSGATEERDSLAFRRRPPRRPWAVFSFPGGLAERKGSGLLSRRQGRPCASSNLAPSAPSRDAGASGGLISRGRQVRFLHSARTEHVSVAQGRARRVADPEVASSNLAGDTAFVVWWPARQVVVLEVPVRSRSKALFQNGGRQILPSGWAGLASYWPTLETSHACPPR